MYLAKYLMYMYCTYPWSVFVTILYVSDTREQKVIVVELNNETEVVIPITLTVVLSPVLSSFMTDLYSLSALSKY